MGKDSRFLDQVIEVYTKASSGGGFSDQAWSFAQRGADQVMSLLEANPPASILDLACGAGGVTTALALKGFDVTGIDCTPAMIDVAQLIAEQKAATVQWMCEDMRLLQQQNKFDFVCLRDVVFSIFESSSEDTDLIRKIALALKPSGRCLFEVYNKEFALKHGVEGSLFYDEAQNRFVRPAGKPGLSIRLYSDDEWDTILGSCGLKRIRMDGWNWPEDPSPPPWRAEFIVAQKDAG